VLLVAAATLAKLLELETAGGRLLVLGGGVVALFALGALQCHDFSHLRILTDSAFLCSMPKFLNFSVECEVCVFVFHTPHFALVLKQ
jgi:hypothetical protein